MVKIIVFRIARLDRGWWRFVSLDDLPRLAMGNLLGSLLGTLAILWIAPRGFPRSIYVLDLLVCLLLTVGVRLAARIFFEASKFQASADKKRTLIYGAGEAGVSLLAEIRHNPSLPYHVVGFIDDDPKKAELVMHGVKVLGDGERLAATARKYQVDTVLIAIPSASGQQMTRILRLCQEAGVSYKTVPGLGEIIKGNGLAKQVRDVAVEDLLGRSPARLDEKEISGKLEGKVDPGDGSWRLHRVGAVPADRALPPEDDCRLRDLGECPVPSEPGDEGAFSRSALPPGDWKHPESRSGWPKCWSATIRRSCTMRPPISMCR